MIDWLNKELIGSGSWNNIKKNREEFKEERINGRLYVKYGINCATTVSYFIYKVYDPSVESFKYAYMLGVARQNPGDTVIDKEEGVEIASFKAMDNPSIVLIYDYMIPHGQLMTIIEQYVMTLPVRFVKTKAEMKAENRDLSNFNRKLNKKNNHWNNNPHYYDNYYNDFKNIFMRNR